MAVKTREIPVVWGATIRHSESRSFTMAGGPTLAAAVQEGVAYAHYYAAMYPGARVSVTLECDCAECRGQGVVPRAGRVRLATKPCPVCRGDAPAAKALGFTFEYMPHEDRAWAGKIAPHPNSGVAA